MVLSLRQHIDLPPYTTSKFDHADVHISTGLIFVAHTLAGCIEIIDGGRCLHINTISGCPEASGVICAQEDNLIFATTRGEGKIMVIDPISQSLIREITSIGSKPNGLAWDRRRRHLLVADVQDLKPVSLIPHLVIFYQLQSYQEDRDGVPMIITGTAS